jgi:hypothetical protein
MTSYRVVAPYVTLPIADSVTGKEQVQGFYAGAIVTNPVAGDVLKKHVDSGMVEKVAASEAKKAAEPEKASAAKPTSKES